MYFRTTESKRRRGSEQAGEQTLCVSVYAGLPQPPRKAATQDRKHATRVALSATPPLLSPVSSKCERRKLEFYQKSPNFRSVPPSTRAANDLQHPSLLPLFLSGFPTAESFSFGEREKEREREDERQQGGTLELPLSPKMGITLTFPGYPPSHPSLPHFPLPPPRLTWLATPEELEGRRQEMDDRNSESSLGKSERASERASYLLHEMTQSRLWTDVEGRSGEGIERREERQGEKSSVDPTLLRQSHLTAEYFTKRNSEEMY